MISLFKHFQGGIAPHVLILMCSPLRSGPCGQTGFLLHQIQNPRSFLYCKSKARMERHFDWSIIRLLPTANERDGLGVVYG